MPSGKSLVMYGVIVLVLFLLLFGRPLYRLVFRNKERDISEDDTLPEPQPERSKYDYMGKLNNALVKAGYKVREVRRFLVVTTDVGAFEVGFDFDSALNHARDCDVDLCDPNRNLLQTFEIRGEGDYGIMEAGVLSLIAEAQLAA